jgi:RNA polymerase sigma factor (sigma-70 family)
MNFEELVKKMDSKLKAIARRLDGRYTVFDDDDLYQEAMLCLWEKYRARMLEDKTDSFILQGCFFSMKNYIRTQHKSIDNCSVSINETIGDNDGSTLEDVIPAEDTACSKNAFDINSLVRDMENMLTGKEKQVFSMHLQGLTTREIGRVLGISHVMVVKVRKRIKDRCERLKRDFLNDKKRW